MKTEIRTIESLSEPEMKLMNVWMKKEFGKKYVRDFKKYYPSESKCFFIKEKGKIISFGIINPVTADYFGKKYNFFGMGDLLTIRRGKGYGRIIMEAIIKYLKNTGKTGLGFCAKKNTPFYKKVGLEVKEDFMKRFRYRDPKTGKVSPTENGDGVFYAADEFIQEILKTDELVYLDTKLW
jgi:GNAT superfamily N-acetyltransferase